MTFCNNFQKNKPYYLPLLLIISVVSHFPFVLNGFGEIDATKIAVSVIDMLNHGPDAAFSNFYFSGVIPLYILYLKWAMKLLNYDYSYLPIVMNYTNAVFGTLTVIPAFLLIRKLFGNGNIAFCSVLALIFTPSFYQASIMGFPHLISFFFLLMSLYFYLSGLDQDRKSSLYLFMLVSAAFLTIAFLFKSDYVLAAGAYAGLLYLRRIKDKEKLLAAFLILLIAGILFLVFRGLILGPGSGTTMSKEGMSKWYTFSLIIPSTLGYFIAQAKPVAYGVGIATFCMGGISFFYYLLKRKLNILVFILSWAALPTLFWLVMIGNNARHNMLTTLPLLVMIIIFFHKKAPKYTVLLTIILILCNFFVTAPSYSILTPSGNLYKSTSLLKDRVALFKARAEEISAIDADKVAVLGTFHNPHVIMEIMLSDPSYKAIKIGRENYKVQTAKNEYVFIYYVVIKPEDLADEAGFLFEDLKLKNHIFVSAMYDLAPLKELGVEVKEIEIIKRSSL